jgi:hypothetical protein
LTAWVASFLTFLSVLTISVGCTRRPAGVPDGAVSVTFSKAGGWAYCWLDTVAQVNRCRTYNADGELLHRFRHENDSDDVFLRYEGSGPVPQDQLQIDVVHSGADFIWLQNGVVLLPRNGFENLKPLIDEMMRIRKNPK